ncbi:hypothetical protein GGTG_09448 [Gaeumannomyces tritici R3-111a-1]|uniref:Uncharacterized protein n=1 Tax=Gaeumannomyces tritici (strain R3-111a-1) TaxID=644352 RepID=J3P7F7_GAET3|nr:hypothetical protein GGTG_09448 [Gaeumannomyces tritici R3-111a-1]EJT72588.1 hypothetical protein GGTG_09448 [Gaeumannomyces tritici R3-111a-1]
MGSVAVPMFGRIAWEENGVALAPPGRRGCIGHMQSRQRRALCIMGEAWGVASGDGDLKGSGPVGAPSGPWLSLARTKGLLQSCVTGRGRTRPRGCPPDDNRGRPSGEWQHQATRIRGDR